MAFSTNHHRRAFYWTPFNICIAAMLVVIVLGATWQISSFKQPDHPMTTSSMPATGQEQGGTKP